MDKDTTAAASPPGSEAPPSEAAPRPAGENQAPAPAAETDDLQARVIEVLKTCFDPEIPVNIYELGLIYSIQVDPSGVVEVRMTLTSPMCPVAGSLPPEVEAKIRGLKGITDAKVEVVWEPPWSPAMMSDAAKLQLNLF